MKTETAGAGASGPAGVSSERRLPLVFAAIAFVELLVVLALYFAGKYFGS